MKFITKQEKTEEIKHINPNCLNSKYCEPHGEDGEVYYSSKNIKELLQSRDSYWLKKIEVATAYKNPTISTEIG